MEEIQKDKQKILNAVNNLVDTVTLTMGPAGKTVIIKDEYGKPYATKDGVSVSNAIKFKDSVENDIAEITKQVAQKTVEEAGDGTTTSLCLLQSFVNTGFKLLEEGISYNEIKVYLDKLLEDNLKVIKKSSIKLKKKDIIKVAKIASNNDIEISKLINKAYDHSNIVRVKESEDYTDNLELVTGMELNTTYTSRAFINNFKKQSIEYTDAKIIIIEGELNDLAPINSYIQTYKDKPIIIVADGFSANVSNILITNYNKGLLNIGLVKSPGVKNHRKSLLGDLALYCGCKVITQSDSVKSPDKVGNIKNIEVQKYRTIITNDITEDVTKQIDTLEKSLKESDLEKYDKELIEQRLINLKSKVSIIKVGGKSSAEIKERKDRIDDSVLAVKSAIEEGIIQGGGTLFVEEYINDKNIDNPFTECLFKPFNKINENGHEINYVNKKDVIKQGIIDPAKVLRCSLENSISVAKVILSIEAVVLNEREWN